MCHKLTSNWLACTASPCATWILQPRWSIGMPGLVALAVFCLARRIGERNQPKAPYRKAPAQFQAPRSPAALPCSWSRGHSNAGLPSSPPSRKLRLGEGHSRLLASAIPVAGALAGTWPSGQSAGTGRSAVTGPAADSGPRPRRDPDACSGLRGFHPPLIPRGNMGGLALGFSRPHYHQ